MSAIPQPKLDVLTANRPQLVDVQQAANMSNRMEHILQAMPSGVVIINGDGIVTDANPVAIELLGDHCAVTPHDHHHL